MSERPDLTDDAEQLKRYIASLEEKSDRAWERNRTLLDKNEKLRQRVERLEREYRANALIELGKFRLNNPQFAETPLEELLRARYPALAVEEEA